MQRTRRKSAKQVQTRRRKNNPKTLALDVTKKWIYNVTKEKDPSIVYKMFASNAVLVGTVAHVPRKGKDIYRYFEYFCALPKLKVIERKDYVQNLTNNKRGDNIIVNTTVMKWDWDGLENPINARMTFIFKGPEIVQLHSSAFPEKPKALKKAQNDIYD